MPLNISHILPPELKRIIERLPLELRRTAEELRVRENRPLEIVHFRGMTFVSPEGRIGVRPEAAYRPTRRDCAALLDLITNHSLYTFEEELRRGYITIAGGHRVGLAGKTVLENGAVKLIRDIAGFNIRIARERIGCGRDLLPHLFDGRAETVHHTLVLSPPRHGKTTLIRDLARMISEGEWPPPIRADSRKVGIVDERSEIAACVKGVPHFDVGPRTDVLDSCPKAEGMMMMIRAMSPDVLVVDEIGTDGDAAAVAEARNAGIRVIATAHAGSLDEARRRPALARLCETGAFGRFVLLNRQNGRALEAAVYDGAGGCLRKLVLHATPAPAS